MKRLAPFAICAAILALSACVAARAQQPGKPSQRATDAAFLADHERDKTAPGGKTKIEIGGHGEAAHAASPGADATGDKVDAASVLKVPDVSLPGGGGSKGGGAESKASITSGGAGFGTVSIVLWGLGLASGAAAWWFWSRGNPAAAVKCAAVGVAFALAGFFPGFALFVVIAGAVIALALLVHKEHASGQEIAQRRDANGIAVARGNANREGLRAILAAVADLPGEWQAWLQHRLQAAHADVADMQTIAGVRASDGLPTPAIPAPSIPAPSPTPPAGGAS